MLKSSVENFSIALLTKIKVLLETPTHLSALESALLLILILLEDFETYYD
jgi:hypothetical protein